MKVNLENMWSERNQLPKNHVSYYSTYEILMVGTENRCVVDTAWSKGRMEKSVLMCTGFPFRVLKMCWTSADDVQHFEYISCHSSFHAEMVILCYKNFTCFKKNNCGHLTHLEVPGFDCWLQLQIPASCKCRPWEAAGVNSRFGALSPAWKTWIEFRLCPGPALAAGSWLVN